MFRFSGFVISQLVTSNLGMKFLQAQSMFISYQINRKISFHIFFCTRIISDYELQGGILNEKRNLLKVLDKHACNRSK